ncbi:MAG TPA: PASTA domain-containing protein, partial [Candidatus Hydrogenedentes bacterium]|nr:PASTA domain-containing protein [Candidatus Hydrogenedentota bacterium]HOV76218.1 PASTA domain-containing protein [Candidatus Hydrogenedentota bacterium]
DPLVPTKDDGQVILKDDTIEVPNVLGLTLANATARIEAEGLVVGNVTHAYGNAAAGDVEAQTPAAGTQVAPGSAVDLVISDGPVPTTTLTVNISPPEAVAAGAMWRLNGTQYRPSGETVTGLIVGDVAAIDFLALDPIGGGCFNPATIWTEPAPMNVTLTVDANVVNVEYTRSTGKQAASIGGDLLLFGIVASALLASGRRSKK